ncbi:DNA polymerase III subunit beta [Candidatus Saccharibacteria bacterium]|nr:DNA polymerase III subunit beta [Candidatus Saccharibacteria bacterium]
MKIIVTQENLNRALNIVGRIATTRASLPILANILFRTDNGRLIIAATNMEVSITETIGAKVENDGAITIPARLITDFVNNLPHSNVNLETDGGKVKISAGGYKSTINAALADDFPELPEVKPANKFTIDAESLKEAISKTIIVASSDTTRPILTGVYVYSLDGVIYFAATDGYRLAEKKVMDEKSDISVIVPASTLSDVLRVLNGDEKVRIELDDEQISFMIGDITITSRLIDGRFIDYRQLIPTKTEFSATVDRNEFIRIVKVAELFARESAGSIVLKTKQAGQELSVESITSQIGENNSTIDAEVKGDGVVTLNSKFLLDALNAIGDDKVNLHFSGKLAPVLLTGENDDYKHIVMPVKS